VGPLVHTGTPPIPHLPNAASAAFTGPEIRNAFEIAAIGRRIDTAKVRRTPIWPASAEWYSWFASNKSQSRKQSSPTPSMRPADALRLWSVGAPSASPRACSLGLRVRAEVVREVGWAERGRAEVPDRLFEAIFDLVALERDLPSARRRSRLRPGSLPACPDAFPKIVKKLVPPSTTSSQPQKRK